MRRVSLLIPLTIRDFHYLGSALLIWLVMLTTLVTDFHDIEVSGKKHISYMIALGVLLSSTFIYSLKLTPRVVVQSLAHSRVVLLLRVHNFSPCSTETSNEAIFFESGGHRRCIDNHRVILFTYRIKNSIRFDAR